MLFVTFYAGKVGMSKGRTRARQGKPFLTSPSHMGAGLGWAKAFGVLGGPSYNNKALPYPSRARTGLGLSQAKINYFFNIIYKPDPIIK